MKTQKRIKSLLKEQKKSVEDLAKAIDKDKTTIYRYLNGSITSMPVSVIQPIADYLNTTPAYIMGWTDDSNNYERLYASLGKIMPDTFLPNLEEYERKKQFVLHQLGMFTQKQLDKLNYKNVLSAVGLSEDEIYLVNTYRKLNMKAQSKLLDYAGDMLAITEVDE